MGGGRNRVRMVRGTLTDAHTGGQYEAPNDEAFAVESGEKPTLCDAPEGSLAHRVAGISAAHPILGPHFAVGIPCAQSVPKSRHAIWILDYPQKNPVLEYSLTTERGRGFEPVVLTLFNSSLTHWKLKFGDRTN